MRSMTGFGRGEAVHEGVAYEVELGSVNRRQADVAANLPRELAGLETNVRKAILSRISRGRVTAAVRTNPVGDEPGGGGLRVDHGLAAEYLIGVREIAERAGIEVAVSAGDLVRAPGVFEIDESRLEPEAAWTGIEKALDSALNELLAMRETEGAHLREELETRLAEVEASCKAIAELAPGVVDHHRKQLRARLEESGLPLPLEDERLLREIGLFAERCDISEELARLDSHVTKFRDLITSDEPTGRSLDFLAQELFREFNTIGAKANSAEIAQHVVAGKTEVEKIREQVQNVE